MHWSPNFSAASLHEGAARHRGGVDRHLVGARGQQPADVLDRAHAAADGERHEAGLGGAAHHVEDDVAVLVARGDVEEGELVGARGVVGDRRLDRIAGVAQLEELHALDDAAVLDVEAGNDADLEHRRPRSRRRRAAPTPDQQGDREAEPDQQADGGDGRARRIRTRTSCRTYRGPGRYRCPTAGRDARRFHRGGSRASPRSAPPRAWRAVDPPPG